MESAPLELARSRWRDEKLAALSEALGIDASLLPADTGIAAPDSDHAALFMDSVERLFLVLSGRPVLEAVPVGILLARSGGLFWPRCSAVLTRPDTVLTARHCLESSDDPGDYSLFFPYEGLRGLNAGGIDVPCKDDPSGCNDDIAVLTLSRPYRFLTPVQPAGGALPGGARARAVGFGASNIVLADRGLMHEGAVTIDSCGCGEAESVPPRTVCFEVDYGPGAASLERFANFGGDSGGALFAVSGPAYELIGLSIGYFRGCEGSVIEGRYVDLRRGTGLDAVKDAFCAPDCPDLPSMDTEILLNTELAWVDDGGLNRHLITVADGTRELLVNLNHETGGFHPGPGTDLSLELPPALHSECSRFYGVEACRVQNPAPGRYSIDVRRVIANPAYQLTAVAVKGPDDGNRP